MQPMQVWLLDMGVGSGLEGLYSPYAVCSTVQGALLQTDC